MPFKDLPSNARDILLNGSGREQVNFFTKMERAHTKQRALFEGLLPNLDRRYRETESDWVRDDLAKYQNRKACAACDGHRLKPEALAVKIADLHAGQVSLMSIGEAVEWFAALPDY